MEQKPYGIIFFEITDSKKDQNFDFLKPELSYLSKNDNYDEFLDVQGFKVYILKLFYGSSHYRNGNI